jgi:hypothetical protein
MDAKISYRTQSMLAMPLRDARREVFGVLQLINAINGVGEVIPFEHESEDLVIALLTHLMRSIAEQTSSRRWRRSPASRAPNLPRAGRPGPTRSR